MPWQRPSSGPRLRSSLLRRRRRSSFGMFGFAAEGGEHAGEVGGGGDRGTEALADRLAVGARGGGRRSRARAGRLGDDLEFARRARSSSDGSARFVARSIGFPSARGASRSSSASARRRRFSARIAGVMSMPSVTSASLDDAGEGADHDVADTLALERAEDRVRVERGGLATSLPSAPCPATCCPALQQPLHAPLGGVERSSLQPLVGCSVERERARAGGRSRRPG